tara:strand:- start:969 stop:1589 length:621 start_codon:yes stop_codon:yes gene_type:complete
MKLKCKICGVSDEKTLRFILDHNYPADFIGFIVNYPKSKRFVDIEKLKDLLTVDKKNSKYVAVLVKPSFEDLEKIKNLNFDFYQIYDTNPSEVDLIKKKYKKKIISALTIKDINDVKKFQDFKEVADIFLFDGKGYEKSISFDHKLIKNFDFKKKIMIAGNIQIDEDFEKYEQFADIIDISGGLETAGLKDISKIDYFLNKLKIIK